MMVALVLIISIVIVILVYLVIKERGEMSKALYERHAVMDNINTAFIYVDKQYMVRWKSTRVVGKIMSRVLRYEKGQYCYETVKGRTTVCPDCPVAKMYEAGKPVGYMDKDDGYIVKIKAFPVMNDRGHIIGGVLQMADVTEEIVQQKKLEDAYSHLQLIFEAAQVNPWELDFETGRFSSINHNVIEAQDMTVEKMITYVNEEDQSRFRNHIDAIIKEEKNSLYLQLRYQLPENNGEERWFEVSGLVSEMDSKGKPLRMVGIRRDIMHLKHTDELIGLRDRAEESNKMKSAFLANMSHEIRTPLNAIVGFSQIVVDLSDNKDQLDEYFRIIDFNSQLLLKLINDILDLSRIEAGQFEMHFFEFEIASVFEDLEKTFRLKVSEGVDLILELPERPYSIISDKNRVIQVLSNFISNACKYTAKGSITMGYTCIGSSFRFYVKDTGKGIDAANLLKVFERFSKFDAFVQGVGLGLSICKSIIENLGGEIGVNSEKGKGSEFWFIIPDKNDKSPE